MKRILIFSIVLFSLIPGVKGALTIADYCNPSIASPKGIKDITPLPDGESFAAISEDGNAIEVFSYKTGKKTGELFNLSAVKGELKISDFEGFKVSDNGKKILLWNESEKIYRYSFRAEYYVYDTFRNTLARVSDKGKQRGATISHDGRFVAYERDNNIWISNLDYKTDNPITNDGEKGKIINGIPDWSYEEEFDMLTAMRWNGDDTVLAYIKFDESDVPEYSFDLYRGYCNDDPLGDLYPATYGYKYMLPGFKNAKVTVHAYNLDNRTTKKMDINTAENDYIPSIEFSGDGSRLMVMVLNRDQNKLQLYNVNPASTVAKVIITEESSSWLSPSTYQEVVYNTNDFAFFSEKSGYRHVYLYDYNGGLKRTLTKGNFNVTKYYGCDARGVHYVQTTQLGPIYRSVESIDPKGLLKNLTGTRGTSSAAFSKNMNYFVKTYSSSDTPAQYTICSNLGKQLCELEMNREYAQKYKDVPKMEFLKVPNSEGEEMNAYIIKPSGFDASRKYPVVMYQYNGPESQEVLDKWRMEGIFYLASQGYIVACTDGRGTGNRTSEWTKCVYLKLGEYETQDQLSAVKYFSTLPYVDSARIGCFGWSYGGYMTLMEVGAKDSPLKAGVAMAPVTDWRFYDGIYTERFMRTPVTNHDGYKNSSALNRTQDTKARVLLISGTDDDNVHIYNTLKYASKLSSEGKVCDMMVYAGFEHSLRMCDARVQLFRKIADFLDQNLKN